MDDTTLFHKLSETWTVTLCAQSDKVLFNVKVQEQLVQAELYCAVPANDVVAQSILALHAAQFVIHTHHSVIGTDIAIVDPLVYRVHETGVVQEYVGAVASYKYVHVAHVVVVHAVLAILNLIFNVAVAPATTHVHDDVPLYVAHTRDTHVVYIHVAHDKFVHAISALTVTSHL